VTFLDGASTIAGCASLALANGAATCNAGTLAAGVHTVTARYAGDARYDAASSPALDQVVNTPAKANSAIGLVSSANPATVGDSVTFTATVSGAAGTPTGTVSFLDGASPIAGCASLVLVSANASCTTSALAQGSHAVTAQYSGDAAYNAASKVLTQTVNAPPPPPPRAADLAITQAAPASVTAGDNATFTLTVSNAGPDAATSVVATDALPGGTTLVSASAGCTSSNGQVTCSTASLASGASISWQLTLRTSAAGTLTNTASVAAGEGDPSTANNTSSVTVTVKESPVVTPPPQANTLLGLSTRMQVLTGDNVLIGGFIIGGSAPKTVVVRARGPSLTAQGIANALADPVLTLVPASGTTIVNDDWGTAANAAQLSASGFAPSDARESAILVTLDPGAYTAIVSGAGGGTGVAIVEVFEVDRPDVPLSALSTRGRVATADNVMIGGFIIPGDTPRTVLVRARGPSLASQGVASPLANPVLQLVRAADNATVASNDDWGSAANAAQVLSSGFAPPDARESAILMTLDPGAYTAIVSGLGGGTGVAIVEVFAP